MSSLNLIYCSHLDRRSKSGFDHACYILILFSCQEIQRKYIRYTISSRRKRNIDQQGDSWSVHGIAERSSSWALRIGAVPWDTPCFEKAASLPPSLPHPLGLSPSMGDFSFAKFGFAKMKECKRKENNWHSICSQFMLGSDERPSAGMGLGAPGTGAAHRGGSAPSWAWSE